MPIEPLNLSKNQKKKWKKKEREMKKKQAAAQTGDESGSSEPTEAFLRLVSQIDRFKENMLKVIEGLQSEREAEWFKAALDKFKKSADQSFARKLGTSADE